jgi:hypothetical protein
MVWMMARSKIEFGQGGRKWRVEKGDIQIWIKREKWRCEHDHMQ